MNDALTLRSAAGGHTETCGGEGAPDLRAFLIEETARATLRELRLSTRDADAAVVRVVLSIAGLSWREQVELLDEHPEILAAG